MLTDSPPKPPSLDSIHSEVAAKISSGEYFREARATYHTFYTDPLTERYFYVLVTIISSIILAIMAFTIDNFLPLNTSIPFVYKTVDAVEDLPRIRRLGQPGEDTNQALREFLVWHYVQMHEEYNVQTLDKNATGLRAHSTEGVFAEFQSYMDPRNPSSPITQFEANAVRRVELVSINLSPSNPNEAEVQYNEVINSGSGYKKARMQANITFSFNDITVNQDTGFFTPLEFIVTSYQTRKLQDL